MAHRPAHDLRALHLQAVHDGQDTLVAAVGDAEGLLWSAPWNRVLRLQWQQPGVMASELHALLDDAGRPLAWWQRSVAARWVNRAGALLPMAPNATLHEVAATVSGLGVAGHDVRARCHESFLRMLADIAGADPQSLQRMPDAWQAPLRNRRACPPALRGGATPLVP